MRWLLKSLKEGQNIAILPDQIPEKGAGQFAPFFATEAETMTLACQLAQKVPVQVLGVYAERIAYKGFRLHIQPIEGLDDSENGLTNMNQAVAQLINRCPEQYQWGYKRYKNQPDGTNPYDKSEA